jgi:hypothetical protein
MRASIATIGLVLGIGSAASAQLAPLDAGGAPAPMDGLAAVAAPAGAAPRDAAPDSAAATPERCREQAQAFRYRNTQSPSQRRRALEACVAAAERGQRVKVAGP